MNMNHRPSTSEEEYFAREELVQCCTLYGT